MSIHTYVGEYRGVINSRIISLKFDNSTIIPSKWFPNANFCGKDDLWQKYAEYHASVLSGKQKGNYLIFNCTMECVGYGNYDRPVCFTLAYCLPYM